MLTKGIEVEVYTGTPDGKIVGFADKVIAAMPEYACEPDSRNVEYITKPFSSYAELFRELIKPRRKLRKFLKTFGDYTLIPGSTLSLGDSQKFYRSKPDNPYHSYIEKTYHTKIVTASVHINVGIDDHETLIRCCNRIRAEAALFLALSASSPFLDGKTTGYHSTRWMQFPKTHGDMPVFRDHAHFIEWVEKQLELGTMHNVRHLWTAVRPNGKRRPYELDRLELRICDLVADPEILLAITAFLEARIRFFQKTPLKCIDTHHFSMEELLQVIIKNEENASINSMDAQIIRWDNGEQITAKDWLMEIYQDIAPVAEEDGFIEYLRPIEKIFTQGNQSQIWLRRYENGETVPDIIKASTQRMLEQEQQLWEKLNKDLPSSEI